MTRTVGNIGLGGRTIRKGSVGIRISPEGRHGRACSSAIVVFVAATEWPVIDGVTCTLQTEHDFINIICP
jgi:hypothetical protein